MTLHSSPPRRRGRLLVSGFLTALLMAACAQPGAGAHAGGNAPAEVARTTADESPRATQAATTPSTNTSDQSSAAKSATTQVAIFAGGCFWCMEPPYDDLPGVISTEAGYIGGGSASPTYEQVSAGRTGHAEALRVTYDPRKVDYPTLLEVFWRNIDPVAVDRQFCDVGDQYRSAIFPVNDEQRRLAEASKKTIQEDPRFQQQSIATRIEPADTFYPAEDYHQDYYRKNPVRYKYYRYSCGRDRRLEEIWGEAR